MGRDHTGTFTEKIKRQVYLDKLRVLATVLVIAVHTVSLGSTLVPERSAVWYGFEISNYLFLCCNLLFIMISGALLLPVKGEPAGQFYRKRFLKVLVPMVIYYILYVCAKEGFVWLRPDHWGAMLKRILLGAPEEAPHFWLIYVIIWLYVLTPFFRYAVQHIPDSVLSGLVAVILIFQILGTYWDTLYYNSIVSGILGSFAGVFILGYYLTREQGRRKYFFYGAGILSVCLAVRHIFSGAQYHRYLFNNAPLMVFYTMAIFLFVRQIYVKAETEHFFTKLISRYSFGILLIHWGVLHYLVKQIFHVSPTDFAAHDRAHLIFFTDRCNGSRSNADPLVSVAYCMDRKKVLMRYKTSYDFNEKSMESYFMTDEYVERRRAYVNEIRRSFDRPEVENGTAEEESQPLVPWIFLKIRIVLAVLLMLAFLLLKYNAYEFHGYQAKDVIDIISDNQYYTILQDYVMINEHD